LPSLEKFGLVRLKTTEQMHRLPVCIW